MTIEEFSRWHIGAFLAALALTVAVLMLTGKIHMRGLLRDKHGGGLSPMRIQLLLVTLSGAASYTARVIVQIEQNPSANMLPDPPQDLLLALGASHALYLGGKISTAFNLASKFLTKGA